MAWYCLTVLEVPEPYLPSTVRVVRVGYLTRRASRYFCTRATSLPELPLCSTCPG